MLKAKNSVETSLRRVTPLALAQNCLVYPLPEMSDDESNQPANKRPKLKRRNDESDDESKNNGFQATFSWQHYHFALKPNTPLETEVLPTLQALVHRVLFILNEVERDTKNRDILPLVGRKFIREASEKHREPLLDAAGNEYSVQLTRRDVPRVFYEAVEGLLPKLSLCPQLLDIFSVSGGKRACIGGPNFASDAPAPLCTCGQPQTQDDEDDEADSPSELWEAVDKATQRAKKAVDEHWQRRLKIQAQSMQQLREHAKISEQRAVEAEQRLAEERESNAKLWEKLSAIQKQLQKMTRPLLK